MSATDDRVILTPEQAESLLPDGATVHNFVTPGMGLMLGCDWERAAVLLALKKAVGIELAGDLAMSLKHPIAVWDSKTHVSFFAADMTKVEAFQAANPSKEKPHG